MSAQAAYMFIAEDSEYLKTELATIAEWPDILGLATDVRIADGWADQGLAAMAVGAEAP